MTIHHASGFAKEAGLWDSAVKAVTGAIPKITAGLKSVGSSLMGGGNVARAGNMAGAVGTRATRVVPQVTRAVAGGEAIATGGTKTIGVGRRIMRRGMIGAGVGAGTSMLGDTLRGEDINVGKALTRGAIGGALGAASGTTVGKRFVRRTMQSHSSPGLSFSQAANPLNWGKAMSGQKAVAGAAVTKPTTAWKAMSPLDKAFTIGSGLQAGKAIIHPDEHTGEHVGGAVGNVGAMMIGSRWKGMRRAWKPGGGGGLGSTARSIGILTAGDVVGRAAGRKVDKAFSPPNLGEVTNAAG